MVGDVEHDPVRSVKLGFVEGLHVRRPPRETLGAELFELVGLSIDVIDQHAEMMDTAEVEARSLIPAEPQDRETDGAVAEEDTIGRALALGLGAADFDEI